MDIVDRINTLCKQRQTNKNAVEKACGLSHGAIEKWRNHSPQLAGVMSVAKYFSVSVEYLMTGKDTEKESISGEKYYFTDETAEMAQKLYEDRDLRALFDASRDARPDDLKMAADMLKRFKATNPDG